jgi:hypothetical protein
MPVKRKDTYIATRNIRDKERETVCEAENLRRIDLNVTLEDSDL